MDFFISPDTFQIVFAVMFPFFVFGEYQLAWFWAFLSWLNWGAGYPLSVDALGVLIIVVWLFRESTALAALTAVSPLRQV